MRWSETWVEAQWDPTPDWTGGKAVRQRMIRTGRYKLNYYDGYAPQLFDMLDDPTEQRDLAADPRFAAVREALLARLLADWDPREIEARMGVRARDKALIAAWGRAVRPESAYLWELRPEDNFVDAAR